MAEKFEVFRATVGTGSDPEVKWDLACLVNDRTTAFGAVETLMDAGHSVRLQARVVRD